MRGLIIVRMYVLVTYYILLSTISSPYNHDSGKRSQQEVVLFLSFLVFSCMRCTAVLTAIMSSSFVVPYNRRLLSLRTADRRTFLLHLELPFSHIFFLPFFLSTGCLFAVWLSLSYY